MMVYAMIWNWVTLVLGMEEDPEFFGRSVQCLAEFSYADDGIWDSL